MSSFTDPLIVKIEQGERDGQGLATLVEAFRFYRLVNSVKTVEFTVPAGFVTDFASVPWFARTFIPIMGRHAKAAVLHDYLLELTKLPYNECNDIFDEALRVLKVYWLRRTLLVTAVRLNFLFKRR